MLAGVLLDPDDAGQGRQRGSVERLIGYQRHCLVVARAALQLQRRAIGEQAALSDDHRAGAQRRDLFEDMGGNDHDLVAGQALDELAHLMLLVGVEAIGRLVEDQHTRIMQNRLSQADAALEALGQRLDALLQHRLQFHLLHRVLDAQRFLGTAKTAHLGDEGKETTHAHVAVARRAFREVADLPLGLECLRLDIATQDARRAGSRREKPREHLHGGGFTGPVGAEKAQHFPWLDTERQIIDCRVLRETLGQVSYLDHGLSPSRKALRSAKPPHKRRPQERRARTKAHTRTRARP